MNKKSILLIEDDPFIAEMYAIKFKDEFDFDIAQDGETGLKKLAEKKPDLILLDIILPKMDGFEVLQKIKLDPNLAPVPVVLLTNLGQKENIKKGLQMGALDYIVKAHFTPSEVVDKIKKIFEGLK
ncbi:MAG: response regulator [candidate division WOR-3 bacterium]